MSSLLVGTTSKSCIWFFFSYQCRKCKETGKQTKSRTKSTGIHPPKKCTLRRKKWWFLWFKREIHYYETLHVLSVWKKYSHFLDVTHVLCSAQNLWSFHIFFFISGLNYWHRLFALVVLEESWQCVCVCGSVLSCASFLCCRTLLLSVSVEKYPQFSSLKVNRRTLSLHS